MNTITVPFYGNELYVVDHEGEAYTPMRPIIEGMGLTYQGQAEKLKSRFAKGVREILIPTKGGEQSMLCLALRKLNGWLQSVNPKKVKSAIRDKVIQYQDECDDVLYEYWTKGVAINPRRMSVMEELNQACADLKHDSAIASLFGTGLNEWKGVKAGHRSKIRALIDEANLLLDFTLAETGRGKITRT